jgi:hypothetical protein
MLSATKNQAKLATIAAAAALLLGSSAYAASVHLKPPNRNPTFTDLGIQLRVTGNLAGLGNEDVLIDMIAQADATAVCINPGTGEHQPPGQNPAPVTVGGQQVIPATEIKNGNVMFSVTTTAPTTPVPGAPDCPNPNWTEEITDLAFTSAVISVFQPAMSAPSSLVLTLDCTFDPATENGLVPNDTVSCTADGQQLR